MDIKRPRDAEQRPGAWPNGVGMEQGNDEALHEVQCPACGATIRARMADQPDAATVKPLDA